jgi:hypothetical protein
MNGRSLVLRLGFRNVPIHKWWCLLFGKGTSVVVSFDGLGWLRRSVSRRLVGFPAFEFGHIT